MKLPLKIENLKDSFAKIPGIGHKSALRHTLAISNWSSEEINEFSKSLQEIGNIKNCLECGIFSDDDICTICSDEERVSSKIICVVENLSDCMAIENSQSYTGIYYVLGGVLNPLLGIGPDEIGIDKLYERAKAIDAKSLVLALNPSVEGDATCSYIKKIFENDNVEIERIGFGVPMGGSLEYLDSLTISKALDNKQKI